MSRLRRPFLSDRYLFLTVCLLRSRLRLDESDFSHLALAMARMRTKHGFLLTAWVFLPDHWHAIICPTYPLTISHVMKAIKVSSMIAINHGRRESAELLARTLPFAKFTLERSEGLEGKLRSCLADREGVHADGGLYPSEPGAARLGGASGGVEMVERG